MLSLCHQNYIFIVKVCELVSECVPTFVLTRFRIGRTDLDEIRYINVTWNNNKGYFLSSMRAGLRTVATIDVKNNFLQFSPSYRFLTQKEKK